MAVAEISKLKTSAAGQYLGYSLQPLRMCIHLLRSPSDYLVSLEYIDDVAIHLPGGNFILEQTKSALSGNPAADRSPDLWKTLANWADLCAKNTVDPHKCVFRYFVTPSKHGDIVGEMDLANNKKQSAVLLERFKEKSFLGIPGVGVEPNIQRFLAAGDQTCLKIIENFEFVSEEDPLETLRASLRATVSQKALDKFCEVAIGQVENDVRKRITLRQPPLIAASVFQKKFQLFFMKYDLSNMLVPSRSQPHNDEIRALRADARLFVRQLEAVDASESLVNVAINDFLMTTADKINWADKGDILESSMEEMDAELIRQFALSKDEVDDENSEKSSEQRGRMLYRRCQKVAPRLDERELPRYFVAGEYNYLADELRLGWHPDYKEIFAGD